MAGVKANEKSEARRRSVWLPATVLILLLALDGAAFYWLTQPQKDVAGKSTGQKEPDQGDVTKAAMPSGPEVEKTKEQTAATPPKLTDPAQNKTDPAALSAAKTPARVVEKKTPPSRPKVPAPTKAASVPPPPPVPATPKTTPQPQKYVAAPERRSVLNLPKMPPAPPSAPLSRAPDSGLVEKSRQGSLPIVGRDGREAWRVYARPFDQLDRRPRISVVLSGLGTSGAATRAAIQGLPGVITLAFSPYADGLNNWIADARAAGHEILLMIPMEPRNYPDNDPGPRALLTSLTGQENTNRLEWILGRGTGYVGVTDFMGSRFTNSAPHMRALLRSLKKRGLMFLESRVSSRAISGEIAAASKVPFAATALSIDLQASRPAIDGQLAEAERLARKIGEVVVMGSLYPVTLERVAKWAATVENRGFVLAPVSAIAKRRN